MKKALLFVLLCLMVALLSGCGCDHNYVNQNVNYKLATCTEDGYTGEDVCEECGKVLWRGEKIKKTGHQPVEANNGYAATCETDGLENDQYCRICNEIVVKGKTIKATGHQKSDKASEAKEPTCEEDGRTGGYVCKACGVVMEGGENIPALGHIPGELTGVKEATCKEDGYTGDVFCERCQSVLQKGERIAALPHTYENNDCELDKTCSVCGTEESAEEHSYSRATETEPATCVKCGKTKGEPIKLPFYCSGEPYETASNIGTEMLLNRYFSEHNYYYRESEDAVRHYMLSEDVSAIYDDGEDVLLTSKSGFYFGKVVDEKNVFVNAMLTTEAGYNVSPHGDVNMAVYKNENGYWIVGQHNYSPWITYIDMKNQKLYNMDIEKFNYYCSEYGRFLVLSSQNETLIIDRDSCTAQLLSLKVVAGVPYFNEDGTAIFQIYDFQGQRNVKEYDYYRYCLHYYYSWNYGCVYKVKYKDYRYFTYVDDECLQVEEEFSFDKIVNGQVVWSIKKTDMDQGALNTPSQNGHIWQYGTSLNWYNTYLMDKEITLSEYLGDEPNEKYKFIYFPLYNGRYSMLTFGSLSPTYEYLDQTNMNYYKPANRYLRQRIVNDENIVWIVADSKTAELTSYMVYLFDHDRIFVRDVQYGIPGVTPIKNPAITATPAPTQLPTPAPTAAPTPVLTPAPTKTSAENGTPVPERDVDDTSNMPVQQTTSTSVPTAIPTAVPTSIPTAVPTAVPPEPTRVPQEQVRSIPGVSGKLQHIGLNAYANSHIVTRSGDSYDILKALDGNEESSWQFNLEQISAKDVYIAITMAAPSTVDELWLKNGFWKYTDNKDQYTRNGRLKDITVSFRYGDSNTFEDGKSIRLVDDKKRADWQKLYLGRHENVTAIRIQVNSYYEGAHFKNDVAVSEIMVVRSEGDYVVQYTELKKGSKGAEVQQMKQKLQQLGYYTAGADMSDSYNDVCVERVKQFQKRNNLPTTGVADQATLQLLYSDKALPKN